MNIILIKEKITWYKLLFTILVTLTAGSVGWVIANYSKALPLFVIADTFIITSFLTGIIFCFAKVRFYFKKLGELKDV